MNAKTAGMQPDAADVRVLVHPSISSHTKCLIRPVTTSPHVFFWRREQLSILRSHVPSPTVINKMSLKISSSNNEVPLELGNDDRTGIRST